MPCRFRPQGGARGFASRVKLSHLCGKAPVGRPQDAHLADQPANLDQAIHRTEGQSLRQIPTLDVKLMTKDQDLSFQRDPRPEQQDQHRPDQAVSFSHKTEALRNSASCASRIRFPIGTAYV